MPAPVLQMATSGRRFAQDARRPFALPSALLALALAALLAGAALLPPPRHAARAWLGAALGTTAAALGLAACRLGRAARRSSPADPRLAPLARDIIECLGSTLAARDREGTLLLRNEAHARLAVSPALAEALAAARAHTLASTSPARYETEEHQEVSVRPLLDDRGAWLGTVEEVRDSAPARVPGREALLAALVEAAPDPVAVTGPGGEIVYLNPAAHELISGRVAPGAGPPALADLRDAAAAGPDAADAPGWLSFPLPRSAGQEAGRSAHFLLSRRPSTGERRRRSAERDRRLGRMASSLAHEVNNPLAAMKMHLALMHADQDSPHASLGIVADQIDRIAATMRRLQEFARPRASEGTTDRPGELLREVAGAYHDCGVRFLVECGDPLGPAACAEDELRQLLLDLLETARVASPVGGEVKLLARELASWIEVLVEHQGAGLGPDPERLFEPFVSNRASGTGLGLSVARRIAELCGGSLTGEDRPAAEGGGARLRLLLPLARAAEPRS